MYGVLGTGSAPAKAIVASLNDIGKDQSFYIPWYGKITPGLEAVYDWVIDNNVEFTLVQDTTIKKAPTVLRTLANRLFDTESVDQSIIKTLQPEDGHALVLWDEEDEDQSVHVAGMAITAGIPTLELTNGLVPIVFNEQDGPTEIVESDNEFVVADVQSDEIESFTREELEIMPASVVKRVATNKGFAPKTKEEAIDALTGEDAEPETAPIRPHSMTLELTDGGTIRFNISQDLLQKIFNLVASEVAEV